MQIFQLTMQAGLVLDQLRTPVMLPLQLRLQPAHSRLGTCGGL